MPRTPLPYHVGDISALARAMGGQLAQFDRPPSHLELLNMLARSAGCRNFQHWRAVAVQLQGGARPEPVASAAGEAGTAAPAVDEKRLRRLARYFDGQARLTVWPGKHSHREPCLWALWSALPAGRPLAEPEVNRLLQAGHLFGDHALLRRWLCDLGLLDRTPDCREYRRVERRPPADAAALIRLLRRRGAQ